MANKKFLEEYPLYRKFDTGISKTFTRRPHGGYREDTLYLNAIPKPALNLYCVNCSSMQTFNMATEYYRDRNSIPQANGAFAEVPYMCASCQRITQRYFLHFFFKDVVVIEDGSEEEVTKTNLFVHKVGQFPAWNIEMDRNLEELLGENADFYKKGLITESQSYGIACFAYFRRITENIIDDLLDSILDLVPESDKEKYSAALAQTKKTRVTQEKIDLVKDLIPESLRPDDVNPLGALHSALSEGLHAEDDETCLEYADAIKNVLVYLVNETIARKESSRGFTEGMRKLLEKKTTKQTARDTTRPESENN